MSEYHELYQQMIIDHGRTPRNFREIPDASIKKIGHNPLCGDKLILFLKLENNCIKDLSFQGEGCAICMASASLMTEFLKGKKIDESVDLFKQVHEMLLGKNLENLDLEKLGKLEVLSGVSAYPARVKCASLAWQCLKAGLEGQEKDQEIRTE